MLVKLFTDQVNKFADKLAVKTETSSLTYKELDQSSNGVAAKILEKCEEIQGQSDNIALLFEHGSDMIVGTIAAVKAGKIYIPFDPSYPEKRLINMLEDSEAKLLVTNTKNLERAQSLTDCIEKDVKIINIDQVDEKDAVVSTIDNTREDGLLYLLYTSGSTGQPKGIIQNQANVIHFIKNYTKRLSITPDDKLTLFSTFGHDAAVMDIYGGLLNGATLYPLNIKLNNNMEKLAGWLNDEGITIWHSVPTLFRAFYNTLKGDGNFLNLRLIVLGGEAVREHDVQMFKKYFPDSKLINLYGQSESSYNSSFIIDQNTDFEKVLLGEPIDGVKMFLIDEKGKRVPPLRTGEIVIASKHVALGYWKKEAETKKAFTTHPKLGKLYWTGDLGRLTLDGNIEFLGRKDFQVKIRGFRVETGEVESCLLKHEAIREAVVIGRVDKAGEMCLSAYYVADGELSDQELRDFLSRELPEHMIPPYFLAMEKIPMNATGKVDRSALPDITDVRKIEYVNPRTQVEKELAAVWSEVLGVDKVGIDDDFFSLGGHSLKATILMARVYEEMNVELSLAEIFKNPTVRAIAEHIEQSKKSIYKSIQPIEEKAYYDVSSAQRRMYILNQLENASTSYNMPKAIIIKGNLDKERVEETIGELIRRHETLRTSFDEKEGKIVQIVHSKIDSPLSYEEGLEEELPVIMRDFVRPFILRKAPLFRVKLVKLDENKHAVLFDMHHIIFDGTSMDILIRDFTSLYENKELPQLIVQYKDYAAWQNELLANGEMESQREYWLKTFAGPIPVLNMPTDYQRPATQSFEGNRVVVELDQELTAGINELARNTRSTLYMVLLAAYNILLSKYTGQEDIVVGSPIAGRPHMDLQNIIGIFINTLAMRNYPEKNKTFNEFLMEVKKNALMAYENQEYQFEELVKELSITRDLSRNPLFDTMFILQNYLDTTKKMSIKNLTFTHYPFENNVSKLDMTLIAEEWDGKIKLTMEYCTKLFKQGTIERLLAHYQNLVKQIVANARTSLADLELILPEEKEQILLDFNKTQMEYPVNKTIHQLFEEQAAKTPDNVAVVFQDKKLTYRELNLRANHVAKLLLKKEVRPETVVAIMLRRSLEMVVGILGILKSGAAYLPIDPDYPVERIKYVFEDSQTRLVLTDEKFYPTMSTMGIQAIRLDDESLYQGKVANLESAGRPETLAYMIYTSGSTGKPKGVMVEHRSVVNFITGINERIKFTPDKTILALTTISFDISGLEILLPLTRGTKVVIANDEDQRDTNALYRVIKKNKVDMIQMTPSRLQMILNDDINVTCLADIKDLLIGGEALPENLLEEVKKVTSARIYNMYGPTETTIWSTVKELTGTNKVTLGKPIANTGVYVVGSDNQLQPIGVMGELCITGAGLARGYWNRHELTQEKFVSNPFHAKYPQQVSGDKMYRTGDIARWLAGGEIEFRGRLDDQIKIRGFRIEPGEIENQLLQHSLVKEAVIVARTDTGGGKYLCAYLTGEEELYVPDLKAHLSKVLPDYMIPTFFIQLEELAYTPNGKVDRKALPDPDAKMVTGVQYVPPTTEIEDKLVKIWEEVLGLEGIGIKHNFFEVGGNSINIIKVINLISKRMGITVPMSELFIKPTIEELASNLFGNPMEGFEHVVRLNKPAEGKKNVFIIHTWEGIIYQYKELAKLLEGEYNIFGIQASGVLRPAKLPSTLEEMITDYICEIKAVQPEGPYIIAGYCYGNWIAYRIVQELEYRCVPVDRLIQIDENAFIPVKARKFYRFKTTVLKPYLAVRKLIKKILLWNKNPMDYWPDLVEYRKLKPLVEGEIRNEMSVRDNVNRLCTEGYSLNYLINTDVYVIKAEDNNLVRYTPKDWRKQTFGKVWFEEIPGGHETLFNHPYVEEFARMFKRALEE